MLLTLLVSAPAAAQNLLFRDDFEALPPATVACPSLANSSFTSRIASADPFGAAWVEISGVAQSRRQFSDDAPVLWLHNDSGNGARFAAYSQVTGARLKTLRLTAPDVDASDWEDIALGPCVSAPGDCLYIANIGNNAAREDSPVGTLGREVLEIYKFPEPDLTTVTDNQAIATGVVVLKYRYGAGSPSLTADAESLIVDSTGDSNGGSAGDLYVISKWNSGQNTLRRAFKFAYADQVAGTTVAIPALTTTFPGAANTRADLSRAGDLLALGDLLSLRIYRRNRNQTIEQALSTSPCATLPTPTGATEFQFESAGFNPQGTVLIEISECTSAASCDPPIHRAVLNR
jgi:hypothetical protein